MLLPDYNRLPDFPRFADDPDQIPADLYKVDLSRCFLGKLPPGYTICMDA